MNAGLARLGRRHLVVGSKVGPVHGVQLLAVFTGPGLIPWSSFNTKRWDQSGTACAKQPINAILVTVPGHSRNVIPSDLCVSEIAPDGDPSGSRAG